MCRGIGTKVMSIRMGLCLMQWMLRKGLRVKRNREQSIQSSSRSGKLDRENFKYGRKMRKNMGLPEDVGVVAAGSGGLRVNRTRKIAENVFGSSWLKKQK